MILLAYGNGMQNTNWKVEQNKPAGYCRVYYIARGKVYYRTSDEKKELSHHTLYFFPSVKSYQIHHDPQDPIDCLWFHIDLFPSVVTKILEQNVSEDTGIYFLLAALKTCLLEGNPKESFYHTLITAMVEYCYACGLLQPPNGKIPEILDYMNKHYQHAMPIEELSRHFNYSPEHFIRIFRKETHFTPYQYLLHRRMCEAGRLLLDGRSVKDVSQLVGYQDAKVFAYRFKKVFSVSPSKYKEFYHPIA